jgi:hypothetical protein
MGEHCSETTRTSLCAILGVGVVNHGGLMAEDLFVASVKRVSDSGRTVRESVEAAVRPLLSARQARLAGRPMSEIVEDLISGGGRDIRLGAAEAFRQFEREIQAMRVGVIRAMIDEEGLSLTDASARLGISRQAGTRLYRSEEDHPVSARPTESENCR